MKFLIITNLFPNSQEPTRGIFNKQQFLELAKLCELKVVAPIPWHKLRQVPARETIDGVDVYHPRYFMVPKIARSLYGFFFLFGIIRTVKQIQKEFNFDKILVTWVYPDGVGASLLAKFINKPIAIKVHGSDINSNVKYFFRKHMIASALKKADKVIAVSNELKNKITAMGVTQEKIAVLPNGVDSNLFRPMDKIECRKKLGLPVDNKIVLYVGNFVQVKGVDVLVEAFARLRVSALSRSRVDALLLLVGDGPLEKTLRDKVKSLSIEENVIFAPRTTHDAIRFYMNAADVFCLASRNEGCPNVLLEALACSTPVVASRVGGIPEIITSDELGILVDPENSYQLSDALKTALDKQWNKKRLCEKIASHSWADNAMELINVLSKAKITIPKKSRTTIKSMLKFLIASFAPKKIISWKMSSKNKKIALTFDDGPNPLFTSKILDVLRRERVHSTFFLVGKEIEKSEQLTKNIMADGHSVGAHSYTHNRYSQLNTKDKILEIDRSVNAINKISESKCRLFRPPQGSLSVSSLLHCINNNLATIMWSIDSGDSKIKDGHTIAKNVIAQSNGGGDIILFHDDNESTLSALPEVIQHFKNKGFEFVTVEEMLE